MKNILKNYTVIGEVHTHLGNGQYSVKDNVKKEHTLYSEDGKIFKEEKHDGELFSLEDVTDYYDENGNELGE